MTIKEILLPFRTKFSWKIFLKNPFTEKTRINPILLYLPAEVDTLHISLPFDFMADQLPAMTRVSNPFGEFSMTVESQDSRSITITRSSKFPQAGIPPEQYEAFRDFIDMLIKKESESIVLKKL